DFPDLLLSSAAMWAFVRRRSALWFLFLTLAVLNREASVLIVVWWLAADRPLDKTAVRHFVASAALGALALLGLLVAFRAAAGGGLQTNFKSNLAYWTSLQWALATDDWLGLGFPLPVGTHVVLLTAIGLFVFHGRHRAPPLVTRLFVSSLLVVFPLFLLFG